MPDSTERKRLWRLANPEKARAQNNLEYIANWKKANPDKVRATRRRYYEKKKQSNTPQ